MVNLMFGANAPRLCRMILDELAKETAVIKGEAERVTVIIALLTKIFQIFKNKHHFATKIFYYSLPRT